VAVILVKFDQAYFSFEYGRISIARQHCSEVKPKKDKQETFNRRLVCMVRWNQNERSLGSLRLKKKLSWNFCRQKLIAI